MDTIVCHLCHIPYPATEFHQRKRVLICCNCRSLLATEIIPEGSKRCSRCFAAKELEAFYLQPTSQNAQHREAACIDCLKIAWTSTEAHAAQNAYARMKYATDPIWRAKVTATSKRWAEANPDMVHAKSQRWVDANPERSRTKTNLHRAKKAAAPQVDLSPEQWLEILHVFNYHCAYCPPDCVECHKKTHVLEQEHITPVADNGSYTLHNIVPACRSCNATKHTSHAPVPVQPLLLTVAPSKKKKGD